jgi:hypothetical protein
MNEWELDGHVGSICIWEFQETLLQLTSPSRAVHDLLAFHWLQYIRAPLSLDQP